MGKTYKILVCGKRSTGKTVFIEQLVYNRLLKDKYYPTIEDVYTAYWEKDKIIKEKFRFYDTKGMENLNDQQTIESIKYLFTQIDACIFIYSSNDIESYYCCDKLKNEIDKEKLKEKSKDILHYIAVDFDITQVNDESTGAATATTTPPSQQQKMMLKNVQTYDILYDKREQICKAFNDLACMITQINTSSSKSAMNLVSSIKKPKVFSSK